MSASTDNRIELSPQPARLVAGKVFDIVYIGKRNAGGGVLATVLRNRLDTDNCGLFEKTP